MVKTNEVRENRLLDFTIHETLYSKPHGMTGYKPIDKC
jgi:hypothetical protein